MAPGDLHAVPITLQPHAARCQAARLHAQPNAWAPAEMQKQTGRQADKRTDRWTHRERLIEKEGDRSKDEVHKLVSCLASLARCMPCTLFLLHVDLHCTAWQEVFRLTMTCQRSDRQAQAMASTLQWHKVHGKNPTLCDNIYMSVHVQKKLVQLEGTDQGKSMESALLTKLQDGVGHMVMEGAENALCQPLPLSNDEALHEHIQGFLVLPLSQQAHTLKACWTVETVAQAICQAYGTWESSVNPA